MLVTVGQYKNLSDIKKQVRHNPAENRPRRELVSMTD